MGVIRPNSTRVKKLRGKNAFRKFGVVPRREQTKKRLEKFYMRTFYQAHAFPPKLVKHHKLEVSNKVYRNQVSKPNYLKYKLMREILEK